MSASATDTQKTAVEWHILDKVFAEVFTPMPDDPLPIWASKHVFLDRRMTTRPGFYDPFEYAWTWEFQEILRTREVWEKVLDDGATVIVDANTDGATCSRVFQVDAMKGTQTGLTESALNAVRYCAKYDPQNVIFAIDNARQAGEVNEIRLQPTLRDLGAKIFTDNVDDAGKFILKLRRMIVYFLGSYSEASFTQKMCELAIGDELEEHGSKTTVEDLRSRMKSSDRRLLALMSKPKFASGPIAREHANGSQHVAEIACPHCAMFQQLEQDNMKFEHCKNALGEWDFERVLRETYFECVHCKQKIEEKDKRTLNARENRRWRRTNFAKAEPNHISFHLSDFFAYDESVSWGRLAVEYINSKGDPEKRRTYRNHHEGLPYEERAVRTSAHDLMLLRSDYARCTLPWLPRAIILGADVGLTYTKWVVVALRATTEHSAEAAVIDFGSELHPNDLVLLLQTKQYQCAEDAQSYGITLGGVDEKYRKLEVQQACMASGRRLWPTAGLPSDLTLRSVNFSHIPQAPPWFGIITYNDRDAKHELYTDRISSWAQWKKLGSPAEHPPTGSPLHYFRELSEAPGSPSREFLLEHTKENLIELPGVHSSRQFVWKRSGPNHYADAIKVALVMWRYFTSPT
jgi:hypothetical protein